MKKFLLILFLFGSTIAAMAQNANQCGIIIPPASLRSNFSSVYEAGSYIDNMLDHINWKENFEVREQNGINNAYATIIRNQRYIVYDNRFLESHSKSFTVLSQSIVVEVADMANRTPNIHEDRTLVRLHLFNNSSFAKKSENIRLVSRRE